MRRSTTRRPRLFGPLLVFSVAVLVAAGPARAQITFDGNMIWNNNNLTYPAGQYLGTPGAGAPACAGSHSALVIGTVDYANNTYLNPLLDAAFPTIASHITNPVFQPAAGSPAYVGTDPSVRLVNPGDPFFTKVCFVGAMGPRPQDDWTTGWTYYDSTGAGRMDLHLPGMPSPRPLVICDNQNFTTDRFFSADSNYLVRGTLRVYPGGNLHVPAGTVIFGERSTLGTIIAQRGGKLDFQGTRANPIITTSDDPPGTQRRGGWGGIWMLGRAVCNCANTALGDSCASEGGAIGYFGGSNDHDNSGTLRYVRCEYSGFPISPDNELNSFTFDGVGDATTLEYLQAHRGDDDGIEMFGGVAQMKYCIATDGNDDGWDWQMGFRGKGQFIIVRELADGLQTDKGIEADNNEFNFDTPNGPRSYPTVSNFTFIGDRRAGAAFPGCTYGVHLRRGTGGRVINSIIANFKRQALNVQDDATYQAACLAGFTALPIWCDFATADVPLEPGNGFASRVAPNPFCRNVAISFTLAAPSHVQVDIYSIDGRRVDRVADGEFAPGPHALTWAPGRSVPSGIYFYRVHAGSLTTTGHMVRVE